MAEPLRFDGRVALVTGAGAGIGREYALLFAERGAAVVVNDLGGTFKGEGSSTRAADQVVEEIKAKGGKAVPNYDSVEFGEKLVETALQAFGRIDIIVNNAGIIRDKSFARISDLDWDLIHKVHLRGAFSVTRAAWPHMKKQNYGRIIMTSSASGIYGNFGQANYSSAKLGLVGFCNTLAIEGQKYNIHCNTVAPSAGSRMTETVMPPELVAALKPEYIAPLTVYLCHEGCQENGSLFEVGAGWIGKLRWQRTKGAIVREPGKTMTPEQVRDKWNEITDFSDPEYPSSAADSTRLLVKVLRTLNPEGDNNRQTSNPSSSTSKGGIDPEVAKSSNIKPGKFTYGPKEVILYALGVGSSTKEPDYLKFLFEGAEEFCVLPSFAVIPAMNSTSGLFVGGIPGLQIDPTKILHGEQYVELFKPIPTSGTLTSYPKVADILDKGSGAVILLNVETFDEKNEKVAFNQFTTFVTRAGGFGGKRNSDAAILPKDPPSRPPDASMTEKTSIDQAALYRLSGDRNPLHIDPSFAAMGGFNQPILHGMCTFGFATRHVLKQYANNDVTKIKAIKVRMSKPVLPGETLKTDMWKEGSRVFFQCKVVENGNVCLSGSYVDLNEDASAVKVTTTPQASPGLQSDMVFHEMAKQMGSRPGLAKKIGAIYLWNITKDGQQASQWTVDMKSGDGAIYRGEPAQGKADCTITVADGDFAQLVSGKLNAQEAFMKGLLKLKGNIMLAQKLGILFQEQAKL
ncbi:hypothetical protein CHS0354_025319 [Potamilus streckersoni]|uniref:Peroxisomal multifunctional enzyme type 2 n=1 Tax=Potamilus streckersoni TaxID=2493646 RepID=A0AAE0RUY2_9BIVA|nr:hypothetical protein CHS0354_025319 [Potamilus streckersoni]